MIKSSRWMMVSLVVLLAGGFMIASAVAQGEEPGVAVTEEVYTDTVSINVEGGKLVQVLSAFARQTGKSIVIGPDVEAVVNVHLTDVPWQDALDVILKPYGYGYQQVGEAIVVNGLDKFQTVEMQEPLASRVFHLKYLDAAAVKDMIQAQLTSRGNWSALTIRGQRGWAYDGTSRTSSGASGTLDRRQRAGVEDTRVLEGLKLRSKTLVVVDTSSVIEKIDAMLREVDIRPIQILIEARFVEVSTDFMKDVGVEFGTGPNATQVPGVQPVVLEGGGNLVGVGARQTGGGVKPASFSPQTALRGTAPYQAGLSLMFQQLTDLQFEVLLHMMEEDVRANLLSSPRVMTLNDQEATIMVGTKYPIIESSTSGGQSDSVSTSLDYYENIGIQLNVIPQICDNHSIRMVVNPKVRTLISTTSGKTGEQGNISLTEYPILSTREAETHILVQSGETVVIGGLLEDQESKTVLRVPILGSIPIIGRLFRREAVDTRKMDLLIFLSATIIEEENDMVDEVAMREATTTQIVEMEKSTRELTQTRAREKSAQMAEEARQEELRRAALEQQRVAEEALRVEAKKSSSEEAARSDQAIEDSKAVQRAREAAALEAARAEVAAKLANDAETSAPAKLPPAESDAERESVIKRFPPAGQ